MDPINAWAGESFAWCFSHGRLHRFLKKPWCTATWARLAGTTEAEALADKAARFGDATFSNDLPLETQVELMQAGEGRTA
jgi:hypothetical protein